MKKHLLCPIKVSKKMIFLLLLPFFTLFSCENNEIDQPLAFEVVLLDSEGSPTTTFKDGESPVFAIKVTNTTEDAIVWYNHCFLYDEPELYNTYVIATNDVGEEGPVYIGKPYKQPVFCVDAPMLLSPGDTYQTLRSWSSNPDNGELTPGNYLTEFTVSINVNNDATYTKSFSKEFSIQ